MSNTIDPDDPRADRLTYVAVCRACGGWQSLCDAETDDAELKKDIKRIAARCVDRNADFVKVRFGDVNLTMCECSRTAQKRPQEAMPI